MIQSAGSAGRAALITIPMAGYVSADASGTVDETQIAPSSRWREVVPKKSSIYPRSSLSLNPDKTDAYVFTDVVDADDFALWRSNFGRAEAAALESSTVPEPGSFAIVLTTAGIATFTLRLNSRRAVKPHPASLRSRLAGG